MTPDTIQIILGVDSYIYTEPLSGGHCMPQVVTQALPLRTGYISMSVGVKELKLAIQLRIVPVSFAQVLYKRESGKRACH